MAVCKSDCPSSAQTVRERAFAVPRAGRLSVLPLLIICLALFVLTGCGGELSAETRRPSPAKERQALLNECAQCHDISRGGGPSPNLLAPRFSDVARHPATTALSLRVFLQSMHQNMPDFLLSARERDEIITYILSLKPNKPL
jgi:mono/diheme cytochrome c family protein